VVAGLPESIAFADYASVSYNVCVNCQIKPAVLCKKGRPFFLYLQPRHPTEVATAAVQNGHFA